MDARMVTREALQDWALKTPFEPFEILKSDGQRLAVCEQGTIALGMSYAIVALPNTDRTEEVNFDQIAFVKRLDQVGAGHDAGQCS
jgi:hypothetical protein